MSVVPVGPIKSRDVHWHAALVHQSVSLNMNCDPSIDIRHLINTTSLTPADWHLRPDIVALGVCRAFKPRILVGLFAARVTDATPGGRT